MATDSKSSSSSTTLTTTRVQLWNIQSRIAPVWDVDTLDFKLSPKWMEATTKIPTPGIFKHHDHEFPLVFHSVFKVFPDLKVDWSSAKDYDTVVMAFLDEYAERMRRYFPLNVGAKLSDKYKEQKAVFRGIEYDRTTGEITFNRMDLYDSKTKTWRTDLHNPKAPGKWVVVDPIDLLRTLFTALIPRLIVATYRYKTMDTTNPMFMLLYRRINELRSEIDTILPLLKMKSIAFGGCIIDPIGDLPVSTCLTDDQFCSGDTCQECYYCSDMHCQCAQEPARAFEEALGVMDAVASGETVVVSDKEDDDEPIGTAAAVKFSETVSVVDVKKIEIEEESVDAKLGITEENICPKCDVHKMLCGCGDEDEEEPVVNENLCKECKKELGKECECQCKWTGKKGGTCLKIAHCHFCGQCEKHCKYTKCPKEEVEEEEGDEKADKCTVCNKDGVTDGICAECKDTQMKKAAMLCKNKKCGPRKERFADCKCGYCTECCYLYGGVAPCRSSKNGKCVRFAVCCVCRSCKDCCAQTAACLL